MRKLFFIILINFFTIPLFAQTPSDTMETPWHVTVSGGYSNLSNAQTNNGYVTSLAVRIAKHWNARIDSFTVNKPSSKIVIAGPEYNFSLAHLLKNTSFVNTKNLEAFVNVKVGGSHVEPCPQNSGPSCVDTLNGKPPAIKFAFGIGGGLNYKVNDMLLLRPLDVTYVRSAAGNQFIGNHLQFATGIGLRF